jgi:hypothetical protein
MSNKLKITFDQEFIDLLKKIFRYHLGSGEITLSDRREMKSLETTIGKWEDSIKDENVINTEKRMDPEICKVCDD